MKYLNNLSETFDSDTIIESYVSCRNNDSIISETVEHLRKEAMDIYVHIEKTYSSDYPVNINDFYEALENFELSLS